MDVQVMMKNDHKNLACVFLLIFAVACDLQEGARHRRRNRNIPSQEQQPQEEQTPQEQPQEDKPKPSPENKPDHGDLYDNRGFNSNGIHKDTGTKYNPAGFDKSGYNVRGFNAEGIHKMTGSCYDPSGFNQAGFDSAGRNTSGFDFYGFDSQGIHSLTGTDKDPHGFNASLDYIGTGSKYDSNGYNIRGFHDTTHLHHLTSSPRNPNGYDQKGFNVDGLHELTQCAYGPDGYNQAERDILGFDKKGLDILGYNREGFNSDGFHFKTKTKYDPSGYAADGFNNSGTHKTTGTQYNPDGIDKAGFNPLGFDLKGEHKTTHTPVDPYGFTQTGLHSETETQYAPDGYNRAGFNSYGQDKSGNRVEVLGIDVLPAPVLPVRYYLAATSREYLKHLHNTTDAAFTAHTEDGSSEKMKAFRALLLCKNAGFSKVLLYKSAAVHVDFNDGEVLVPVSKQNEPTGFEPLTKNLKLARYSPYTHNVTGAQISGRRYAMEMNAGNAGNYIKPPLEMLRHTVFTRVYCQ